VLVVTRHRIPAAGIDSFDAGVAEARDVLELLATRAGFIRGWVARAVDDADLLVLAHEWADVGSYRRALGSYEVKLHAVFLQSAADEASAFEVLTERTPEAVAHHSTAVAPDTGVQ
jgi:hypothetical protein